jgi:hypothetical protein
MKPLFLTAVERVEGASHGRELMSAFHPLRTLAECLLSTPADITKKDARPKPGALQRDEVLPHVALSA